MRWAIRVTCDDCTGVDEMGCNGGEPWWHEEAGRIASYATREDAEEAAIVAGVKHGAPWSYEAVPASAVYARGARDLR